MTGVVFAGAPDNDVLAVPGGVDVPVALLLFTGAFGD